MMMGAPQAPRILAFYQPRHGRIMLCAGGHQASLAGRLQQAALYEPVPRRHSITLSLAEARELAAALGDAAEDGPSLRRVRIRGGDATFHKDIVAELIDALNEALAMPDHAEALAREGEAH